MRLTARGPPRDRSVGVRVAEVGAADGRCGRGLRRHHACEPACATARSCPIVPGWIGRSPAGVRDIAIFAAASETFSRRNINSSIDESFATYRQVTDDGAPGGPEVRAYLSTSFGCPFEGDVPVARVRRADRAAAATRRLRSRGQRHDRDRASRAGVARARCAARRAFPSIVSRCTFTTRAARRSPTSSPRCSTASRRSTARRAGSAAARTRQAPRGISRPRI